MEFVFEIYLTQKNIESYEWQKFIKIVSNYNGYFKKWKIIIQFENNLVRYFVKTTCLLPPVINEVSSFLLKEVTSKSDLLCNCDNFMLLPLFLSIDNNAIDILNYMKIHNKGQVSSIEITLQKIYEEKIRQNIKIYTFKNRKVKGYKLFLGFSTKVLAIDFQSNYNMFFKTAPKYLDISKSFHLLKTDRMNSILKIDTFPYLQGNYYLDQKEIDFFKHSIIFGSSGCGKSKFISLLIHNIYKNVDLRTRYKICVIDPHAALEYDIGGLGRVIDFKEKLDSIDLFVNDSEDVVVSVSLLLDLFKGLLTNLYNPKLERVLRYCLYLLLISEKFNFSNLRKVLIELEYRNLLLTEEKKQLPISVYEFFLTEFNDIKVRSYTEAIAPIIGLIDEMEMLPVFNNQMAEYNLKSVVQDNFLTIFSLDQMRLGEKVSKTIAGLVMQQMLILAQKRAFSEHIIFIVDEVAVIENPILNRFLAEARKYNLSLMLAGQYFDQISDDLKKAIFANVVNYYIFRVAKSDANILVDNFNMKIPLKDEREEKIKIITNLQNRECLVRVSSNGILLPAVKGMTLDFKSIPRVRRESCAKQNNLGPSEKINVKKFDTNININLRDILIANSSSRKELKK